MLGFDNLTMFPRNRAEEAACHWLRDWLGKRNLNLILTNRVRVGWDGLSTMHASGISNAIHEAAHWLVAAEERRSLQNYGIGSGPEDLGRLLQPTALSPSEVSDEERAASLLGVIIERELGLPWEDTFAEHNWVDCHEARCPEDLKIKETVTWLRKHKHIRKSGGVYVARQLKD